MGEAKRRRLAGNGVDEAAAAKFADSYLLGPDGVLVFEKREHRVHNDAILGGLMFAHDIGVSLDRFAVLWVVRMLIDIKDRMADVKSASMTANNSSPALAAYEVAMQEEALRRFEVFKDRMGVQVHFDVLKDIFNYTSLAGAWAWDAVHESPRLLDLEGAEHEAGRSFPNLDRVCEELETLERMAATATLVDLAHAVAKKFDIDMHRVKIAPPPASWSETETIKELAITAVSHAIACRFGRGTGEQIDPPDPTNGAEMTALSTCICVWDPKSDGILFEGSSSTVGLDEVRSVIGADAFPEDPELVTVHPITREQGIKLIRMMGLRFDGDGEFQLSRELIDA